MGSYHRDELSPNIKVLSIANNTTLGIVDIRACFTGKFSTSDAGSIEAAVTSFHSGSN